MKTSWIVRAWVWLRRIGYCRGFGIQSPWAYSLVRYVINEHFPYYAYAGLYARFPEADIVRRKLGQFYLRLANYVQPAMVMSLYFTQSKKILLSKYSLFSRDTRHTRTVHYIGDSKTTCHTHHYRSQRMQQSRRVEREYRKRIF